jgi:hypothetical protein
VVVGRLETEAIRFSLLQLSSDSLKLRFWVGEFAVQCRNSVGGSITRLTMIVDSNNCIQI